MYLTALLTCDLSPLLAGSEGGTLHLTDMPSLEFNVAPLPPSFPKSRTKDVVCARGLFGHVDGHAVVRALISSMLRALKLGTN